MCVGRDAVTGFVGDCNYGDGLEGLEWVAR